MGSVAARMADTWSRNSLACWGVPRISVFLEDKCDLWGRESLRIERDELGRRGDLSPRALVWASVSQGLIPGLWEPRAGSTGQTRGRGSGLPEPRLTLRLAWGCVRDFVLWEVTVQLVPKGR